MRQAPRPGQAEFLSPGALLWTGKRSRGPRLSLFLYLDHGDSCPGWEGIFTTPALYLDGSAAGVFKLRVGGRKTVRVTQRASCVDQVAGTRGDASACTLSATADVSGAAQAEPNCGSRLVKNAAERLVAACSSQSGRASGGAGRDEVEGAPAVG